jgi:hypothetical protein
MTQSDQTSLLSVFRLPEESSGPAAIECELHRLFSMMNLWLVCASSPAAREAARLGRVVRLRGGSEGCLVIMEYFWIMLGSPLGGGARYLVSGLAGNQCGQTSPWGTLIVNVTGSSIIGFLATFTGPDGRLLGG